MNPPYEFPYIEEDEPSSVPPWPKVDDSALYDCNSAPPEISDRLKSEDVLYSHNGYNWAGRVWYDKEESLFKEEVWQYKVPVEVVCAATLNKLIEKVNRKYR